MKYFIQINITTTRKFLVKLFKMRQFERGHAELELIKDEV